MVARATLLLAQPGRIHCRCRRRLRCLLRRDVTFRRTQAYSAMVAAALAFWVKALLLSGADECARVSRLTDELIRMRRLCGQNPAGCNETVLHCCPGWPGCGPKNRSFLSELHRRKPACCRQFVCKSAAGLATSPRCRVRFRFRPYFPVDRGTLTLGGGGPKASFHAVRWSVTTAGIPLALLGSLGGDVP